MTAIANYDPHRPIGERGTIIEASAGTGKTFTVAAVVTWLVAEKGVPLEEILVVTFTRAATAELKDRVRKRMIMTLRAFRGSRSDVDDDHLRVLLGCTPEQRVCRAGRLDKALTHFDRAQIFTIHGFTGRLLHNLGFRSRLPGDAEPGEIDDLVVRRAASDVVVRRFASPQASGGDVTVTGEVIEGIGRAVIATPDARIVPDPDDVEGLARLRAEMAREMETLLSRRLSAEGRVTFDATLVEARDALLDPHIGEGARALLRDRYRIALVDEAQDTDPIQWQILRAVFGQTQLVAIGDPKQSIYAFRGADIESYLSAADRADTYRTLRTNWRSDGRLIAALDKVLAGTRFGDERIEYRPVRPAKPDPRSRISGAGSPLEIRRFAPDYPLERQRYGAFFFIGDARRSVAGDVASETVKLLATDVRIKEGRRWRPIEPGDIAVLCRTGRQVDTIRDELTKRAVPSVVARTGSVFATNAAEQWRRFLLAVERPNRHDFLRLAGVSEMVGMLPEKAADLQDDAIPVLQQRFLGWQRLLHDHGVPAMFADLDRATRLTARVLARPGGERDLTDMNHIAEEMHAVWRTGRIGSLVNWIEAAMDEADREADTGAEYAESRQRRLDTDAAAVQVMTIHAAKGLEYPVVMAPYLWDKPRVPMAIPVFHDQHRAGPGEPRRRLLDVGGSESPDFDSHLEAARSEEAAEEGRLLYVALTRAKHRLVVWWIENTRWSGESKLHRILAREGDPDRAMGRLVDTSEGAISQTILDGPQPCVAYESEEKVQDRLGLARMNRSLDYGWRRVSFSSLSPGRPLEHESDTVEDTDRVDEAGDDEGPAVTGGPLLMAGLPRGPRFGSLVHRVLQNVAFDASDLPEAITCELARLTRHSSWDFNAETFVSGLVAVLETPLGPDPGASTLRDLRRGQVLKELDFELPLRTSASNITLDDVAGVALEHLASGDPHRSYFTRLQATEPHPFRGFLAGSIDLMTRLPGAGRESYVVMDFKSNTLPMRGDRPETIDYGPLPLTVAMHHGNYVLQALLYQVALHRYLQLRLAGYDPSVHLGGSLYLFIRGMIGAGTPIMDGERGGIARWKPPPDLIVAVSDLFAGHR